MRTLLVVSGLVVAFSRSSVGQGTPNSGNLSNVGCSYSRPIAAQTTVNVLASAHGCGAGPTVTIFDASNVVVLSSPQIALNGDVTMSFVVPFTGRYRISSGSIGSNVGGIGFPVGYTSPGSGTLIVTSSGTRTSGKCVEYDAAGNITVGVGNAPCVNVATYLVQTAVNAPPNAQIMANLGSGIVKNNATTGVQSIAIANDFPILNQNTTGVATTAISLAVTPVKCASGQYPLGVDAYGNAANCTVAVSATAFNTAGQGFFFPLGSSPLSIYSYHAVFGANNTRADQFVLNVGYTFRQLVLRIGSSALGTSCPGGTCGLKFGIYNGACTSKLGETTVYTGAGVSNTYSVAFSSPLVLTPGVYWLLQSSDSTVVSLATSSEVEQPFDGTAIVYRNISSDMQNLNAVRHGTPANLATGNGAGLTLPSTCGVVAAVSGVVPVYMLEP